MHRLSHLVIKNFRACREVSLPLEGYTPLVGQNNAGKSTILQAIGWVLKPGALTTADFLDAEQPVEIVACIDGIDEEVLARIPEEKHRQAIEPYCREGRLWIRAVATGPSAKAITKEVWDITQCPDASLPSHWRAYPTGLPQAVSALLPEPLVIQAMHDIGEDLGNATAFIPTFWPACIALRMASSASRYWKPRATTSKATMTPSTSASCSSC